MAGVNASAFVRLPFQVNDPQVYDTLTLDLKYDDGFVAYLNDTQVASVNAPGSTAYDSAAIETHDDTEAVQFETFDLSEYVGLLQPGSNVLAIQALNASASEADLLLTPRLSALNSAIESVLYFTSPTPGAANGAGFLGFVEDTMFSVDRGFYDAPFDLMISSLTSTTKIYYTTDGSAPSETNGALYVGPISITETTTLRAFATLEGYLSTNVDTHSYIFLSDVLTEDGMGLPLPPFPGTSNWDYEMDPNIVNDPRFSTLEGDLQTLPTLSLVLDEDDAFGVNGFYSTLQEGQAAERPVSVELISTDGVGLFQEDAGIRVFGSGSLNRALGKKSMRLVFRSNFGPTKLDYPFFGPGRADEFDTIAIRGNYFDTWTFQSDNGGLGDACCGRSRSTYLRDQFAHETHEAMGAHAIAGNFMHIYINGVYWGLFNPTERPDEEFMQSYFGGADADYDVIKTGVSLVSGDLNAWNEMFNIVRGDGPNGSLANDAAYDDLKQYLDIDDFIDYMLVNFYGGNHDWPHNNWYVARNREAGEPFRFIEWDAENYLFNVNSDRTGVSNSNTAGEIYDRLRQNDEFNLRFADRVQQHMFNNGALTVAESLSRFQNIVDTIRPALNAESARWGDELQEPAHNTIDDFDAVVDEKLNSYFPARTDIVLGQLKTARLYPVTGAPTFSQHGGHVASGFNLNLSAADGLLYYTLDGSDPRESGGTLSANAIQYSGAPIEITSGLTVRARALNGGDWSALSEAAFSLAPFADGTNIRITELHYNPAAPNSTEASSGFTDNNDFEFIELYNPSFDPVELQNANLSGAMNLDFTNSTILAPGERAVIVEDQTAFELRYGSSIRVLGEWSGGLSNGGETIVLSDRTGEPLADFTYQDGDDPGEGTWPTTTDGLGRSLVVINIDGEYSNGLNWRASATIGGSPGADETPLVGDYSRDGLLSEADYTVWKATLGSTTHLIADGNRNQVVDAADYTIWRDRLAQAANLESAASAIVYTSTPLDSLWISEAQSRSTAFEHMDKKVFASNLVYDSESLLLSEPSPKDSGRSTSANDEALEALWQDDSRELDKALPDDLEVMRQP